MVTTAMLFFRVREGPTLTEATGPQTQAMSISVSITTVLYIWLCMQLHAACFSILDN